MGILRSISNASFDMVLFSWDFLLVVGNLVRFKRAVGKVTPSGHPGYGGHWPEYKPPGEGDSRCCCPGLNAMANHGIVPRSGKGISFAELTEHIHATYNFSASFSYMASLTASRVLNKKYNSDTFDLEEINLHNGIEHDGSVTRLDTALQPNQAIKHQAYIDELCSFATGKDAAGNPLFTNKDLSRILGKRRAESKATNPGYSLHLIHRFFSSANTSTIQTIFGKRVDDVRIVFSEERIPDGWESRVRKPYGLTMFANNVATVPVEFRIREADWATDAEQAKSALNAEQAV